MPTTERPWWGPVDGWLAVPFSYLATIFLSIPVVIAVDPDTIAEAAWALVVFGLAQQFFQLLWPIIVSRRKGLGLRRDWGLYLGSVKDFWRGVGLGIVLVFAAGLVTQVVTALIGLDDPESASNTGILTDHENSPWIIGIVFMVVIGAPITEELLFRGVMLRSFLSYGRFWAIALSTIIFVILHYQFGEPWRGNVVLLTSLTVVGLTLAIASLRYKHLGPSIVAHMVFNGVATIASFAT